MSLTWRSESTPATPKIGPLGWALILARGIPAIVVLGLGLGTLCLGRLVERPLAGARRPATPWITVGVCRLVLAIMGLRRNRLGRIEPGTGAIVANHTGWLDILVLNAVRPVMFVSKAEVAGWPGIGLLAQATGTLFIRRTRGAAEDQRSAMAARMAAGHTLVLFAEGTSSDGMRVLPFRTTLFSAFLPARPGEAAPLQPVTLRYHAPAGRDPRFYGWWGDMDLGPHLRAVLAAPRQGSVDIVYHALIRPQADDDRKSLAARAERAVRRGFDGDQASAD